MRDAEKHITGSLAGMKVAFICGQNAMFIEPIERILGAEMEVRSRIGKDLRLADMQELVDWADVTWFDWCDQILIHASNQIRKSSKVICRLHHYEAYTDFPEQVNWSFVDQLVFVAPHIREIFNRRFEADVASSVIVNGVNPDDMPFAERTRSYDLAYVGYLNYKKNPALLLQCLAALVEKDRRYVLHVAGKHQDRFYVYYFEQMIEAMGLEDHVRMYGWVDDIPTWLSDKGYVLSTSLSEGCPYGLIEAMAAGIKPVIHNWQGALHLFPSDLLFNTIAEAVEIIEDPAYDSQRYRAWVEERYTRQQQVASIRAVFREVLGRGEEETKAPMFQKGALNQMLHRVVAQETAAAAP